MNSTERSFYAPGRVNLIGDHTDYCGGLVFPCAIESGIGVVLRQDDSIKGVHFSSADFAFTATVDTGVSIEPVGKEWINYPLGVIKEFTALGHKPDGIALHYSSNLPSGAGLSSSACISVVTAFAVNQFMYAGLSRTELALMARRSENEFVNTQCGIMDQFIIANAVEDCAMSLDCATLQFQQVPLQLDDYKFVISNSNQPRELAESGYNQRVAECRAALAALQQEIDVEQLAHITPQQLQQHQHLLTGDVLKKRARHVVEESNRVVRATQALQSGDHRLFGRLMVDSHESLRDLFEVCGDKPDCLVEIALSMDGVLGSRMTGGGFGGCTVSLVHAEHVNRFIEEVGRQYKQQTGLSADFYVTAASAGVHQLVTGSDVGIRCWNSGWW